MTAVTTVTAVGALVFTGLSFQATRDQLGIAETQQITERFTKAVEHLGDDKTMDVRLGAVLALERIARDSATDREAVGTLLAAFVRRKRPVEDVCRDGLGRDHADVAAALRVVARARLVREPDLSWSCLSGADLRSASLRCAVLEGVAFQGTTKLAGADLRYANLGGARLDGAYLFQVDLRRARLSSAQLVDANLARARLGHAELHHADLTGALLKGADLRGARLGNAILTGAELDGVRWAGAHIGGAKFSSEAARAAALAAGAKDTPGPVARTGCPR